jgi:hypothetical protein
MEVELVTWPRDADRRSELERDGLPRLLLVEPGAAPPFVADVIEDWVRLPSDEREVALRISHLQTVAVQHRAQDRARA